MIHPTFSHSLPTHELVQIQILTFIQLFLIGGLKSYKIDILKKLLIKIEDN